MNKPQKITALALGVALALVLLPATALAATNVTINLTEVVATPAASYPSFSVASRVITVTAAHAGPNDTVTITGNGGAGYSIVIEGATNIVIEAGTTIQGASGKAALTVPDDATITGQEGAVITIKGGDNASGNGGNGIHSAGSVKIAGTVDSITGGSGADSYGIYAATGNINIAGTIGAISGGLIGIAADAGDVSISGTTGTISGSSYGIFASGGSVTIGARAETGAITGSGNSGISASVDVEIAGKTGAISGGSNGILSSTGFIAISGRVDGAISGGSIGIEADAGDVSISGTTGAITGSGNMGIWANAGGISISGTTGPISGGADGIRASSGSVTISGTGTTGAITGSGNSGSSGIFASGGVEIAGKTGPISGSNGILAAGPVAISGTVDGAISGTKSHGIHATTGSVTINGKVSGIAGMAAGKQINADSYYAVLDYLLDPAEPLLRTGNCFPTGGYTVTFHYGAQGRPDDAPRQAFVSNNGTIPVFRVPDTGGSVLLAWYKEQAWTNEWNFIADEVSNDLTLYAKWETRSTGGGYTPPAEATVYNANNTVWLSGGGLSQSDLLLTPALTGGDYNALLKQADKNDILGVYDISLKSGMQAPGGAMYLTFALGGEYANQSFALAHKKADGSLEYFHAVADASGNVKFGPLYELSPFMLIKGTMAATGMMLPQTGDSGNAGLGLALLGAALLAALAAWPLKKKRAAAQR